MRVFLKIVSCSLCLLLSCGTSLSKEKVAKRVNVFQTQAYVAHNIQTESKNSASPSYLFNGEDSYIELNEEFDRTFSFCAWIKPADLSEKHMAIVGIPNSFWFQTTTKREFQFTQPNRVTRNTEGLLLSADNWIFVSLVIDYPSIKIYLDAKLVGEFTWVGKKPDWKKQVLIGKDNWRDDFHGIMQDIQIFKEALDEDEINNLYEKRPVAVPLNEGILLYHSFNSKKHYYSSSQYEKTNNVVFVRDSIRGMVAQFNGSDSYIDFGELFPDNTISISAWIKQEDFNRINGAIAAFGYAYAFRVATGGVLLFTLPQITDVRDTGTRVAPNEWQHVAVTFKEKVGLSFYLNGKKSGTYRVDEYQAVSKELQIGTNLWNDFFKGQMDDLVIWNRLLTDEEIREVAQKDDAYWKTNIKYAKKPWGLYSILVLVGLVLCCIILVRYYKKKKGNVLQERSDSFRQELTTVVLQNLSDSNFSVKEFAEALLMSKTKLYNELKSSLGRSPKEFIREVRLSEAAKLLIETNIPVSEIIYETGFESRAYFNKCFKEMYNVTPTDYRKKARLN